MKIRAKLIVVFLAISVLPLAAVTFYSYSTSRRAMREAAQAEAGKLAAEMSRRMGAVTTDLGQKVTEAWGRSAQTPEEQATADAIKAAEEHKRRAAEVAQALGRAALFIRKLEFVSPHPPGAGQQPGVEAVPGTDTAPGGDETGHVVFDFTSPEFQEAFRKKFMTGAGPGNRVIHLNGSMGEKELEKLGIPGLSELMGKGAKQALDAMKAEQAGDASNEDAGEFADSMAIPDPGEVPEPPDPEFTDEDSNDEGDDPSLLDLPVKRDGQVVGTVSAKLDMARVMNGVLSATHLEQGEIPFAIDSGSKIYTPREKDRAALSVLDLPRQSGSGRSSGGGRRTSVRSWENGDWVVVTKKDPSGMTFGIARPIGDSLRKMRGAYGRNLALGLLLIGAATIGIVPLSGRMTRNLSTLTEGARRIAQGDLDARVPVRSADEFGALARAFNGMAEGLKAHAKLQGEQERLRRELELCRQIQTTMLPQEPMRAGIAEIKGLSIPAREVGGDFFNYFALPDGSIAVLVGDVSGKGVGAALLMSNIQATLRARLPVDNNLVRLAGVIDKDVEATTPREVFLTLFIGILDTVGGALRWVNAGHNTQYILRAGGGLERLESSGLPLGLYAGHGYKESSVALAEGDLLVLFTDGIVEAQNPAGDMFGAERLEALLADGPAGRVDAVLDRIEAEVRVFRAGAEPSDDATIMILRAGPPGFAPRVSA